MDVHFRSNFNSKNCFHSEFFHCVEMLPDKKNYCIYFSTLYFVIYLLNYFILKTNLLFPRKRLI